jgi:hypothetical protein
MNSYSPYFSKLGFMSVDLQRRLSQLQITFKVIHLFFTYSGVRIKRATLKIFYRGSKFTLTATWILFGISGNLCSIIWYKLSYFTFPRGCKLFEESDKEKGLVLLASLYHISHSYTEICCITMLSWNFLF